MNLRSFLDLKAKAFAALMAKAPLADSWGLGRASCRISHKRPYDYDAATELFLYREVDEPEVVWNVITNVGRVFLHTQGYATTGIGANGLNYIALSNDTLTETATSTTLSTEIAANGLSRAQGAVVLPTGAGTQTTVDKTFTCTTAPQAAQKSALFTASAAGTMNHALAFTQRSLQVNDTLQVTFTITLGA